MLFLEISRNGVEGVRLNKSTAEFEDGHALLKQVSYEIRALDVALRRPAASQVLGSSDVRDPDDLKVTERARLMVQALGGDASSVVGQTLLDLTDYSGGFCSSDLNFLPLKDLSYLLGSGWIRRAPQGGFCLNLEPDGRGGLQWAGAGQ